MATQTKTIPVRIREDVYATLKKQVKAYETMHKTKTSYSEFLEELLRVSDLLLEGTEVYGVAGRLYDEPAEAWGAAVQEHVRTKAAVKPTIYVRLGEDKRFELPESQQ